MSGRAATTAVIPGRCIISVGRAQMPTPKGWEWCKLIDIARLESGHTPSRQHPEYWNGGIPWIGIKDARINHGRVIHRTIRTISEAGLQNSAARILPTGTVCLSRTASVGYTFVTGKPMATSQDFVNWVCSDRLVPEFLMYALITEGDRLREFGKGTTHTTIYYPEIKALYICLPTPPDQRRIVAEIEKHFTRLDAGVTALHRTQAHRKRYRASLLKAACEGRLVPSCAEKWSQGTLGEVLTGIEAGKSFKCEERPPQTNEVGVVKVSAVSWGSYDELESKTCHDITRVEERYFINQNDFLFSRANTIQLIGACVLASHVTLRVMLSDKILRLRFSPAVVPGWILCWLRSDFGRREIERLSTGNQESMRNIGQNRIRQIAVKFPSIDEQKHIVSEVERRLRTLNALESVVNANLQRATRLRQAILQKAFSGELVKATAVDVAKPKRQLQPKARQHFLRLLLSAEIVHQLHAERTFGQIKHQKIFHLCEHIAQLSDLKVKYHRNAAGPYDNQLIYTNEGDLKKNKWYERGDHHYRPLAKAGGHAKYLTEFNPEQLGTIHRLIKLMHSWDTTLCEILSTTYAAWNDLLIWQREPTEAAILHEILNRWHPRKREIPEKRWRDAITWMKKNGFTPTGFGQPTALPE